MSTLADIAKSARYREGQIVICMESGAEIRFSIADNPRLAGASASQLNNIVISPFGLRWPDLDEDLSFKGIFNGNHGQKNP